MINMAVQLLAGQLNQYLRRTYDLNEDVVVISNLVDLDGSVAPNVNNKLVIFLTSIEKDSMPFRQVMPGQVDGQRVPASRPPIYLNLQVMMAANFNGNNYPEALKFISSTIIFFQRHPLFNHQITPELDERIEKLILEMENLTIQDLSNLWGTLGGKYLPSVLYKVRVVTFDTEKVVDQISVVRNPSSSMKG